MGVAIYTRQSLDKTGEAAGVTRQLEECRAFAERSGYDVTVELSDNDTSATTGVIRPEFERLLGLVRSRTIDTVIVWHPDRLYRKLSDLVRITDIARETGLTIATVQAGKVDLSTASGRMVASMVGSVATYEGEQRTDRQKLAYRARAEAGDWHFSRRPFGYRRKAGKIEQVPEEVEVLKDVLQRYYEQGQSRHSLVSYLNYQGILTPVGKPWGIIQLRDLLSNSHYAGIATYRGQEVGRGSWDAVVSEATWKRWQTAAAKRRRRSTFTPAKYLLSGIARCRVCGGVCYAKPVAERLAYVCRDHQCVQRSAAKVDELVEGVILARLQQPDALSALQPKPAPVEALHVERAELTRRLDDLADLVADGTLNARAARDAAAPIRTRRDGLDARLAAAMGPQDLPTDLVASNVVNRWHDGLTLPQKRSIIRALATVTINRQTSSNTRDFDPTSVGIDWLS